LPWLRSWQLTVDYHKKEARTLAVNSASYTLIISHMLPYSINVTKLGNCDIILPKIKPNESVTA